jgi:hypothetical protein
MLIRLIRLSYDKEQITPNWFLTHLGLYLLSGATPENLSSNIWCFFLAFVAHVLMIIKNITSLTGLQIMEPVESSGSGQEFVWAGGTACVQDKKGMGPQEKCKEHRA